VDSEVNAACGWTETAGMKKRLRADWTINPQITQISQIGNSKQKERFALEGKGTSGREVGASRRLFFRHG
jgi:hypothetical protein